MSLFEMSIHATILIAVIVIIRALGLHHLPKKTFLALWLVVLCRLLIPISVPTAFSFFSLFQRKNVNSGQIWMNSNVVNSAPFSNPIRTVGSEASVGLVFTPLSLFLIVWGIGIGLLGLYFIVSYIKSYRMFSTSLRAEEAYLTNWLEENKTVRKIDIRTSDRISSPLTYGIFRPVILLPKNTNWEDRKSLDYVLTHELIHIERFDALTKVVLIVALCIHWLNPMVWVMYILCNRDIELSCDEKVLKIYGMDSASSYALTLLGKQEYKSFSPVVNHFSKKAISERIDSIMKYKRISMIGVAVAFITVIAVTIIFASSAKPDVVSETPTASMSDVTEDGEFTHYLDVNEIIERFGVFGITVTVSELEAMIYLDDVPVREIWDERDGVIYSLTGGTSHYPANAVDLTTVYDADKLVGLNINSQEEYDRQTEVRNQAILEAQASETAVETAIAAGEESMAMASVGGVGGPGLTMISEDPIASEGNESTDTSSYLSEHEYAELIAEYAKYGLTYEENRDGGSFYYNGDLVRFFIDNHSGKDNKFSGIVCDVENGGKIYLAAERDTDNNLIGIEVIDSKEASKLATWRPLWYK